MEISAFVPMKYIQLAPVIGSGILEFGDIFTPYYIALLHAFDINILSYSMLIRYKISDLILQLIHANHPPSIDQLDAHPNCRDNSG